MENKCVFCDSDVSDMSTQVCVNCQSSILKTDTRNIHEYNFCAERCTKIKNTLKRNLGLNLKKNKD